MASRSAIKRAAKKKIVESIEDNVFDCKKKKAPGCSGKGYAIGKAVKACALCLEVMKQAVNQ